jgi:hypothetical protein
MNLKAFLRHDLGSCIKVANKKKLVSYRKKVSKFRKILNSLPLRRKLLRNFLLCLRSNHVAMDQYL